MSDKPIDRLESRLEALIEGLFTRLFVRKVNSREIAILLLRAMKEVAMPAAEGDARPIAPDKYTIVLHRDDYARFNDELPDPMARMSELIVEFARQSGYRLLSQPNITFQAIHDLEDQDLRVYAEHSLSAAGETKASAPLADPRPAQCRQRSILQDEGIEAFELDRTVINIGRDSHNDIVLDDAFVSRHHLQLRERFGVHILFDVNSRGGTRVNNIAVREHRLQNGDEIKIGRTRLVYSDRRSQQFVDGTTQVLVPD